MFAYCGNSPVSYYDPMGTTFCKVNFSAFSPFDTWMVPSVGSCDGGYMAPFHVMNNSESEIVQTADQIHDYVTNTSEAVVLNAKYVAFYKGVLVIKLPFLDNSGFSFGFIGLGPNVDAQTVRHEYGHYVHLRLIGWKNYIFKVAIPSLYDFASDIEYEYYYSEPQEYIADLLGNVNRTYYGNPYCYNISNVEAFAYFIYSIIP